MTGQASVKCRPRSQNLQDVCGNDMAKNLACILRLGQEYYVSICDGTIINNVVTKLK
jgi:hypothetical protein